MPHKKGTVQPSPGSDSGRVKPEPPVDLWERMDRIHAETGTRTNNDPGFTVPEYAAKYGVSRTLAHNRLAHMARNGKLKPGWRIVEGRSIRVFEPI